MLFVKTDWVECFKQDKKILSVSERGRVTKAGQGKAKTDVGLRNKIIIPVVNVQD